MSVLARLHVSRSWGKDPFAPGCGCPLAPCGLVEARDDCAQHGLEHPRTFRQIHDVDACPKATDRRLSAYRTAARALDVKAALRERGHHVTDEAALNIVHTWQDTNGGPTAMCRALILADVHPFREPASDAKRTCWYADLDAVWAALGSSARPSNIGRAAPAGPETTPVALRCGFCGHWEKGKRTKEDIAAWLRVHRNATIGSYAGADELASICPHPCGSAGAHVAIPSAAPAPEGADT